MTRIKINDIEGNVQTWWDADLSGSGIELDPDVLPADEEYTAPQTVLCTLFFKNGESTAVPVTPTKAAAIAATLDLDLLVTLP